MPQNAVTIDALAKQVGDHLRLGEAGLNLLKQEWVLAELLGTGEPTVETVTHLAELRRAVERAHHRHKSVKR